LLTPRKETATESCEGCDERLFVGASLRTVDIEFMMSVSFHGDFLFCQSKTYANATTVTRRPDFECMRRHPPCGKALMLDVTQQAKLIISLFVDRT
jgi:hypothetical protein